MNFHMNNIKVLGFKGEIYSTQDTLDMINNIKKECPDCIIQLLDADYIAGKKHIIHAVNQSFLAFNRKENLANDLSVEICLRASAQRQISKAFNILGIKKGKINLCIVLVSCPDNFVDQLSDIFKRDDNVLSPVNSILMEAYDIHEKEIENRCIEDIIIDRITKLAVDY